MEKREYWPDDVTSVWYQWSLGVLKERAVIKETEKTLFCLGPYSDWHKKYTTDRYFKDETRWYSPCFKFKSTAVEWKMKRLEASLAASKKNHNDARSVLDNFKKKYAIK